MFLVELVALTVDSVAVAKYYAFAAESVPSSTIGFALCDWMTFWSLCSAIAEYIIP